MYRHLKTSLLAVIVLPGITPYADEMATAISAEASTPRVAISPRPDGRRPFELPSLSYEFALDASCAGGVAQSVMLSVADSRRHLDQASLQQGSEVSMSVPARQIAPLQIETFCTAETVTAESETESAQLLRIEDVLSVQLSLVCAHDDGETVAETISYASLGLDVELACTPESGDSN